MHCQSRRSAIHPRRQTTILKGLRTVKFKIFKTTNEGLILVAFMYRLQQKALQSLQASDNLQKRTSGRIQARKQSTLTEMRGSALVTPGQEKIMQLILNFYL